MPWRGHLGLTAAQTPECAEKKKDSGGNDTVCMVGASNWILLMAAIGSCCCCRNCCCWTELLLLDGRRTVPADAAQTARGQLLFLYGHQRSKSVHRCESNQGRHCDDKDNRPQTSVKGDGRGQIEGCDGPTIHRPGGSDGCSSPCRRCKVTASIHNGQRGRAHAPNDGGWRCSPRWMDGGARRRQAVHSAGVAPTGLHKAWPPRKCTAPEPA